MESVTPEQVGEVENMRAFMVLVLHNRHQVDRWMGVKEALKATRDAVEGVIADHEDEACEIAYKTLKSRALNPEVMGAYKEAHADELRTLEADAGRLAVGVIMMWQWEDVMPVLERPIEQEELLGIEVA